MAKVTKNANFDDILRQRAIELLQNIAFDIEAEAKASIGLVPSPSPPYHPPAVVTGFLRSSITSEIDFLSYKAVVGTRVKYGKFLELGTKRMKPRPFLRPAFEKVRRKWAIR